MDVIPGVRAWVRCPWRVEQAPDLSSAQLVLVHSGPEGAEVVDGIATIRVELHPNRPAALQRLVTISRASTGPSEFANHGGWPAIIQKSRRYLDPDAQKRIGPRSDEWIALTWASAIENRVIRLEARVVPSRTDALEVVERMARSIRTTATSPPAGQTADELARLREKAHILRAVARPRSRG